ncbi:MAG TPA: hypothetical protein VJB82_02035 [Candidatus Peribacterales bacterium]|nr:hypothetical protein [Candidatus Peribacterales bacterium]
MDKPHNEDGSAYNHVEGALPCEETSPQFTPDPVRGEMRSEIFRALADSAPLLNAPRIPDLITPQDKFRYDRRRNYLGKSGATGETILDVLTRMWRDVLRSTARYDCISAPVIDEENRHDANAKMRTMLISPNRCTIDETHALFYKPVKGRKENEKLLEYDNLLTVSCVNKPYLTFLDVTMSQKKCDRYKKILNGSRLLNLFHEHIRMRMQGITIVIARRYDYDEAEQTIWYEALETAYDLGEMLEKSRNYRLHGAS